MYKRENFSIETNLSDTQSKSQAEPLYEDVRYRTYDNILKSITDEEISSISPIPKYSSRPQETQHIQNSIRTLNYDEIPSQDKPMRLQSPFTQEQQYKLEEFYKKEQLSALELARLNRARETKRKMDELYGAIKAERDRREQRRRLRTIEPVELINIPTRLPMNIASKKEESSKNESKVKDVEVEKEKSADEQPDDVWVIAEQVAKQLETLCATESNKNVYELLEKLKELIKLNDAAMKRRELASVVLKKLTEERDLYYNKLATIEQIGKAMGWNDGDNGVLKTIKEIMYSQDIS